VLTLRISLKTKVNAGPGVKTRIYELSIILWNLTGRISNFISVIRKIGMNLRLRLRRLSIMNF